MIVGSSRGGEWRFFSSCYEEVGRGLIGVCSMPYAQQHYPFEKKEQFEKELFPADFICEGIDQTRGACSLWRYREMVVRVDRVV